ncbi:MAG: outer membrane lipoprotein-sorting protein [Myxococcales bacterium]|nr:outer membrane lipoprotein-sorting protein [Myxococcales bacterium]
MTTERSEWGTLAHLEVLAPDDLAGQEVFRFRRRGASLRLLTYSPTLGVYEVDGGMLWARFIGSGFRYRDLLSAVPDSPHTMLPANPAQWVVRIDPDRWGGETRILHIDKETGAVASMAVYDREDRLTRRLDVWTEEVDGHLIPVRLEMEDLQSRTFSMLRVVSVRLGRA